jgi:hypothetical protein
MGQCRHVDGVALLCADKVTLCADKVTGYISEAAGVGVVMVLCR